MNNTPINIANLTPTGMKAFFDELGEKSFRHTQVLKWIHHEGVSDFDEMTNLSKSLRAYLKDNCTVDFPKVFSEHISQDGTIKWIIQLHCTNKIEMVYIPEPNRGTLCVSSQVGCGLNCPFCSTARQGFNRNLSFAEVIGQLWMARHQLLPKTKPVTNVVFMGMGEPLLNYDVVVPAMNLMLDDMAYGLSKYRVTLSTSGVVPKMRELAKDTKAALAVSLHCAFDDERNILVPINRKYPIEMLLNACREFFSEEPRRSVTYEYVMLAGVNDSPRHAKGLVELLKNMPAKVNLIPFNHFEGTLYRCSCPKTIHQFHQILKAGKIQTNVRKTRGDDVSAACGQLVGQVRDRTTRRRQGQLPADVAYRNKQLAP